MSKTASRFCEVFGCRLPLVAAPMLGVSDMGLAAAAAAAGAVGSVPCSAHTPALLDELLAGSAALLRQHGRALVFNFFCHDMPCALSEAAVDERWLETLRPYYEREGVADARAAVAAALPRSHAPFSAAHLEVLVRRGARAVSFHFGLPPPPVWEAVRASGLTVLACATTVAEALHLCDAGVDAIVVQGWEAGGHRGHFLPVRLAGGGAEATLAADALHAQRGTFALLPQVRAAVERRCRDRRAPLLVAAGGVAGRAERRAAAALGADAVQVGSALLLCDECATKPVHAAALEAAVAGSVRAAQGGDGPEASPDPVTHVCHTLSGRPARGLRNTLMADLGPLHPHAPPFPFGAAYLLPLRAVAEPQGRGDYSALWAGQNLSGCARVPVAQKINDFFGEDEKV